VEKVAVLCRFLDIHSVTKNHLLKYSLAHAFCCFLTAVEDVNPAVATRAGLLLDTIKRPALQVVSLYGKIHSNKIWILTQCSGVLQVYSVTVIVSTSSSKPCGFLNQMCSREEHLPTLLYFSKPWKLLHSKYNLFISLPT